MLIGTKHSGRTDYRTTCQILTDFYRYSFNRCRRVGRLDQASEVGRDVKASRILELLRDATFRIFIVTKSRWSENVS